MIDADRSLNVDRGTLTLKEELRHGHPPFADGIALNHRAVRVVCCNSNGSVPAARRFLLLSLIGAFSGECGFDGRRAGGHSFRVYKITRKRAARRSKTERGIGSLVSGEPFSLISLSPL
jgi:hypothetical protein